MLKCRESNPTNSDAWDDVHSEADGEEILELIELIDLETLNSYTSSTRKISSPTYSSVVVEEPVASCSSHPVPSSPTPRGQPPIDQGHTGRIYPVYNRNAFISILQISTFCSLCLIFFNS